MILEKIVIKNWLAFRGEYVLDPVPTGAISVVARYDDNPRRSNWAGKTAFLEAIEWALFGVHRKRYEDDVIHNGTDEAAVSLHFTSGFEVRRSRKRGKATCFMVGVPHAEGKVQWSEKKAAEAMVKNHLGFDADDFRATICFAQGDTEAIVERTSGERRKVIGQWLELDAWLRVSARARAHLKKLTEFYQVRRGEIGQLESWLTETIHEIVDESLIDVWLEDGEDGPVRHIKEWIDGDEETFFETRRAIEEDALKIVQVALEGVEEKIQSFAGIEVAGQNHRQRELFIEEGKRLKAELTNAEVIGLEEGRERLGVLVGETETARSEVREAEQLTRGNFDGMCPVTWEPCGVADEVRENRQAAASRLETARETLREKGGELSHHRDALNVLEGEERTLQGKRERLRVLIQEVNRLEPFTKQWLESDHPSETTIQQAKADQVNYRSRVVDLETSIRVLDQRIEQVFDKRTAMKKIRASFDQLEADVRIANLVVKATSQTGIPAFIAEGVLMKLEERANALLVGTNLSIIFSLDRETKDLAPTCFNCGFVYRGRKYKVCPACDEPRGMKRSDDLEILVEDGSGVLEDVKAKSGGEKVLVGSAIRLAAGLMLRELRGSTCAFSMVDEIHGSLDATNAEMITSMFTGMLGAVGLEQAFVVSHDEGVLDALPSRILITRHQDYSSLEIIR